MFRQSGCASAFDSMNSSSDAADHTDWISVDYIGSLDTWLTCRHQAYATVSETLAIGVVLQQYGWPPVASPGGHVPPVDTVPYLSAQPEYLDYLTASQMALGIYV